MPLTIKERDEFVPGSIWSKSEGDGGQPVYCIETQQDIIMLQVDMSATGRKNVHKEPKKGCPTFSSSISTAIGYSSSFSP